MGCAVKQRGDDRLNVVSGSTVRKEVFMLSKILGFVEHEPIVLHFR